MLKVLFTQDSEAKHLLCGASLGSESGLFFSSYLFGLGLKDIHDGSQHDFARVTNKADASLVLIDLYVVLLGSVKFSD